MHFLPSGKIKGKGNSGFLTTDWPIPFCNTIPSKKQKAASLGLILPQRLQVKTILKVQGI